MNFVWRMTILACLAATLISIGLEWAPKQTLHLEVSYDGGRSWQEEAVLSYKDKQDHAYEISGATRVRVRWARP